MSRGPGRLQRRVLDALAGSAGGPLPYFCGREFYVGELPDYDLRWAVYGRPLTDPEYTAFLRAARGLCRFAFVRQRVERRCGHSHDLWCLTPAGLEYVNGKAHGGPHHSLSVADLQARDAAIDLDIEQCRASFIAGCQALLQARAADALQRAMLAADALEPSELAVLAEYIRTRSEAP